ncbi:PQQ-binding-like beta-propeller repeat protein [Streptomyces boninensis]|uniref:outer membrane protein assembly factor BamB family protein n=1 Tax=Streptomyces boninensis TaxID=2039455 RepID=UPI003B211783
MARRARTRSQAATAIAMLCALLAGGACTGGGGGEEGPDRPTQPKALKKVWERRVASEDDGGIVLVGRGVLGVEDDGDLLGYDSHTGKKRWTFELPKGTSGVCVTSGKPSEGGLVGMLFDAEGKGGCTYAGVVDLEDGKVKWAKRVGNAGEYTEWSVSLGDEALTVTLDCYSVQQFRPRDGKSLGTRLKSSEACVDQVDHNGTHLAIREASRGTAADDGAPDHLVLYEGAGAKPVWRTEADRADGDDLHGIVSDDPLVLDVSREGHRVMQTYDGDGKPVHTIGKELTYSSAAGQGDASQGAAGSRGTVGPFIKGNTLVMGYARDPALYAYDLRTGKVRWQQRQDEATVLGVWKDKLLAAREVKGAKPGRTVSWLMTYGLRDGKERIIGRIPDARVQTMFAAWDDDRIYLRRPEPSGKVSVVAYPLPRSGGDSRKYDAETIRQWDGTKTKKRGWRKGDLRPDAVANACEAVSPTARKAMLVYRKKLPPPEGCAWVERFAPDGADRELDVTVTAHQPGGDKDPDTVPSPGSSRKLTPAVAVAKKAFRATGTGKGKVKIERDAGKILADAHPLTGLGDEAKSNAYGTVEDGISRADILVRYRNVTVRVKAMTEASLDYRRGEVPPQHRVEAAARVAAADVLERLGADVPAAARRLAEPVGGEIDEVKSVCSRLRSESAALVPGIKALDTTSKGGADGRVSGCVWESDADGAPSLTVRVKAVPDSPLTGESAEKQAKDEIASTDGEKLSGFGDEARLDTFTFEHTGEKSRHHTLTVRQGNLLLYVDHKRWHHPSKSQLDADVRRVARRVLSAY